MDPERAHLRRFLEAQGVDANRSGVMARQLQKRAGQIAAERGIHRVDAMEHLLKVVVYGSRGEVYPGIDGNEAGCPEKQAGNPHKQGD